MPNYHKSNYGVWKGSASFIKRYTQHEKQNKFWHGIYIYMYIYMYIYIYIYKTILLKIKLECVQRWAEYIGEV